MIGICSRSRVRNTSGDLFLCLLSTAAALDQFTILLMASPAFWMLRPKKKQKNLRVTALCISCPFITSLRKFSRCYFQNTSKIQLLPTLPVAALNPAPSSSPRLLPALNHCQPLPAVYSEQQPRGHAIHVTPLLKTRFPPHSRKKPKSPWWPIDLFLL